MNRMRFLAGRRIELAEQRNDAIIDGLGPDGVSAVSYALGRWPAFSASTSVLCSSSMPSS